MNIHPSSTTQDYAIDVQPLEGTVTAWRKGSVVARSNKARVMYETRLPPAIYFPAGDVSAELRETRDLQTFCPFKGTASYMDLQIDGEIERRAAWTYADALPESEKIRGYVGFMPGIVTDLDIGNNQLKPQVDGHISGPVVDWILRGASNCRTPEELTTELARKLTESGISISRLSVMIWSLHPLIAGKNFVWEKETQTVNTFAPSYEIHDHPAYVNSPLRHVSSGLGGVRQRLGTDYAGNSFPIMEDLKAKGATDYVAMPLPFADGRTNVLTLTSDHPSGFTTAQLGLVFEVSAAVSRYFEVFTQAENARSLLETYVGKRTGARVLGGKIRRGDSDDIDAAIMFCDLRGSTRLEEELGRAKYINLLNRFFETTSTIIHDNGGEVLKFIGDAVLAVFPAGEESAAAKDRAITSALEIVKRLNDPDHETSGVECDCSIGLAFGQVTYGNVGSRERLDFTVIGQAANIAARLGDFGKSRGHRIVMSEEMLTSKSSATALGEVALHNVSRPVSCFAVDEAA